MLEVKRLSIGAVAARAGVATSALRFYEEQGLIASERREPSGQPASCYAGLVVLGCLMRLEDNLHDHDVTVRA